MIIIPAIDLLDGNVVRLYKGQKDICTIYSHNPRATAKQWKEQGAKLIHVVDLNAAFSTGHNTFLVDDMINAGLKIQVGGGIRTLDRAKRLVDLGVERIVIGSKATDNAFLDELIKNFGGKIAVGVDVLDGKLRKSGWVEETQVELLDFVRHLVQRGVTWIVYTDISRDGTLGGPNIKQAKELGQFKNLNIILSGGIGSPEDIGQVAKELKFVYGLIVGKAVYEGKVDLNKAIKKFQR